MKASWKEKKQNLCHWSNWSNFSRFNNSIRALPVFHHFCSIRDIFWSFSRYSAASSGDPDHDQHFCVHNFYKLWRGGLVVSLTTSSCIDNYTCIIKIFPNGSLGPLELIPMTGLCAPPTSTPRPLPWPGGQDGFLEFSQ